MDDNDITMIVGWPTEPEMVKYRKIAAAAAAAERERLAAAVRALAQAVAWVVEEGHTYPEDLARLSAAIAALGEPMNVTLEQTAPPHALAALGEPPERAETADTLPIVKLTVAADGHIAGASFYAPGLPPGVHDLWCTPISALEEIAELRTQAEAWWKHCDTLTHQVICCGVAASHQDATLTTRGAYAGRWNSAQAEEVRKLRAERDALKAVKAQRSS